MSGGSWTFHHHPIVSLHALDQALVTDLCKLIVKVERGEELDWAERRVMELIHKEIRSTHGSHENQGYR